MRIIRHFLQNFISLANNSGFAFPWSRTVLSWTVDCHTQITYRPLRTRRALSMHCRSYIMTSHKLAHAYFLSVAIVLVHTHCAYMRILHSHNTGIAPQCKCEPIGGCAGGFRDVRAVVLTGSDVRLLQRTCIFDDILLKARRGLRLHMVYGDSTLLVLNRTLVNSANALMVLNRKYFHKFWTPNNYPEGNSSVNNHEHHFCPPKRLIFSGVHI